MKINNLILSIILFIILINQIDAKTKIRRIDQSNFQQFSKDNSYWILQISQSQCSQCQNHQQQLLDTAQLLEGVCKIGKVDAKFLQGMKIPHNPTYLFLRSNKIQDNVEFTQNKITKTSLAKFCLDEVEKAVKKRHKLLFGNKNQGQESSRSTTSQQGKKSNKKYDSTKVIQLTDNQFEKAVLQSKQAWFVLFYSPSCGHCKNLQPQFEKLPGIMGKKVNIARVDATAHRKYAQQYQVRGFPTMFLFESENKQKPLTYQGQRTADDMKTWLQGKKLSKAVKQFHQLDKKTYERNCNRNIVCLIFILQNKNEKAKLKFIKPLLQDTLQKPIEFFFSEKIPQLQSALMIEDRITPKMVAIWEGINSYRIYNGGNNQQELSSFITNLMERKKWIRFQQKSTDLLFNHLSNKQQL